MPRKKNPDLTVEQERFVWMEANGYASPEVILELWGIKKEDDPRVYHNMECRLSDWRKHPKYAERWKEVVRQYDYSDYTRARRTLRRSMDDSDKWLAMQSAVNVMNTSGKRIFGEEENTVTVKIEGLPDIGSPDQDE